MEGRMWQRGSSKGPRGMSNSRLSNNDAEGDSMMSTI